jgi:hypothetical protein
MAIGGTMRPTARHSIFLIFLVLLNLLGIPGWSQQNPAGLQIVIVEGEGALNNIKQRVTRDPIVQVEDEGHKPIAGASVVFTLPNQGPGGTFDNGTNTLTTMTNNQGQAVARGIRFNNQVGSMQIRVTASFGGQTATAVITQTNLIGTSGGGGGGGSSTKWLIILGVAGAVAAGVIVATHGSSSPSTPPPVPTVTITPGPPTVGAPQ